MTGALLALLELAEATPPTDGVFADPRVSVTEVVGTWQITVDDRVLEVEIPTHARDRKLIDAIVESLLTELTPDRASPQPLRLRIAPAPGPTRRPPPPPSPEPPPVVEVPSPPPAPSWPAEDLDDLDDLDSPWAEAGPSRPFRYRWAVWLGGDLTTRSRLEPGGGIATAATWGSRRGLTGRVSVLPGRPTRFAVDTSLREVNAEIRAFSMLGLVRAGVGVGGSVRWYARRGLQVATHIVPQVVAGFGLPVDNQVWRFEPTLDVLVDTAPTTVRADDGTTRLAPLAVRVGLRVGRAIRSNGEG